MRDKRTSKPTWPLWTNTCPVSRAEEAAAVLSLGDIDEDTKRQREEMFNKKYNAAVEQMNLVAEEFNVQVRAYKDINR